MIREFFINKGYYKLGLIIATFFVFNITFSIELQILLSLHFQMENLFIQFIWISLLEIFFSFIIFLTFQISEKTTFLEYLKSFLFTLITPYLGMQLLYFLLLLVRVKLLIVFFVCNLIFIVYFLIKLSLFLVASYQLKKKKTYKVLLSVLVLAVVSQCVWLIGINLQNSNNDLRIEISSKSSKILDSINNKIEDNVDISQGLLDYYLKELEFEIYKPLSLKEKLISAKMQNAVNTILDYSIKKENKYLESYDKQRISIYDLLGYSDTE